MLRPLLWVVNAGICECSMSFQFGTDITRARSSCMGSGFPFIDGFRVTGDISQRQYAY